MEFFTEATGIVAQKEISLDTEYTELNVRKADLLSISIGFSDNKAGVFEPHKLPALAPVLTGAGIIYTQNGAVDWYMLQKNGLTLDRHRFRDAMLMEHLINENIKHGLGEMVFRTYGDNYKSEFWGKYSSFQEAPQEDRLAYETRDAIYTYGLGRSFLSQLQKAGNTPLVEHVHRLYWALFDTQILGLKVNVDLMQSTQSKMKPLIDSFLPKLREKFNEHCNVWEINRWTREISKRKSDNGKLRVPRPEFSFASDDQVKWLIYDSMGCPVIEKTKTGAPATDYETLGKLAENIPELELLVEYKKTKSVYSTFVEGLLERVQNGRIYPEFHVNGTRNAGRISHSNPNMGNMPKEGIIRNFFIPDDGNFIFGADFAQLEVVIEANFTEDKQLLKIINEGASKHDITAQGLGISRADAKTLNFALQYGATHFKVSEILKISKADAASIFKRYWQLYSGVTLLKKQVAKQIHETGFIETPFGRRRHFPKAKNKFEQAKFERQAYNALIQGTGADCTNRATWQIKEYLDKEQIGRLWFSVHDEIVGEAKNGKVEQAIEALKGFMEESGAFINLKYPLQTQAYGPLIQWTKT